MGSALQDVTRRRNPRVQIIYPHPVREDFLSVRSLAPENDPNGSVEDAHVHAESEIDAAGEGLLPDPRQRRRAPLSLFISCVGSILLRRADILMKNESFFSSLLVHSDNTRKMGNARADRYKSGTGRIAYISRW